MAKVKKIEYIWEGKKHHHDQYIFQCPGCGYEHAFALKTDGGYHDFNMDYDNPTLSPSLLNNFSPDRICHSFIVNGKIHFLGDCWHKLAGQIVDIPDYK